MFIDEYQLLSNNFILLLILIPIMKIFIIKVYPIEKLLIYVYINWILNITSTS